MEEVDGNIRQKVKSAIDKLLKNDEVLLRNNVSERAISHKLAEYLQIEFSEYNVDCEYNRNIESNQNHAKSIEILESEKKKLTSATDFTENDTEIISTYPDIIVHKRGRNDNNLLIIEVKKENSTGINFDILKLTTFTSNEYIYKYGLLVIIEVGPNFGFPALHWYSNGKEIDAD